MGVARHRSSKTSVLNVAGYPVQVTRKRVKNINLRIRPDGTLSVSAPSYATDAGIASFVLSHQEWVRSHVAAARARNALEPRWVTGDEVPVWGERRPLTVVEGEGRKRGWAGLDQGGVLLQVPAGLGDGAVDPGSVDLRRTLVEGLWKRELESHLPSSIAHGEALVGEHASEWRIRRMSTRWGSCSIARRRIWLNLELAAKPPECLDYVVIHELCHLVVPNHGPAFHELMDGYAPRWREVRALLNEAPPHA